MKKMANYLFLILIFLLCISTVYAHGVDVTADKMVIASENNGQSIKDLADENNINISVYKFTSNDEVNHQLEHMLNNSNKIILVADYQDVAHEFLKNHPDVKDRLIIVDDVNNDNLLKEMKNIQGVASTDNVVNNDFLSSLVIGIIIGVIIGLGCGIVIMKKKQ